MALPDLLEGTYVSVMVENPATADGSGTYVILCGMTAHTFTEQVNTRDRFTRDCATPGSLPIRQVIATGKQWDLTASGTFNRAQAALVSTLVGQKRYYKFFVGEPADDAVYTSEFKGKALLSTRAFTADQEADVTMQLTFLSDGEWVEEVL